MNEAFFWFLERFEDALWGYVAAPFLLALGGYLSWRAGFVQLRRFPTVVKTFFSFFRARPEDHHGVHPLKAFFACVGGCVGIGNLVGVCTAVQIGGPGALVWVWVTAILGMILKYSEVYLGVRYREENASGGYNGGPMYFLPRVMKSRWVPLAVALLLCVYGVEIYQFSVIVHSVHYNFGFNSYLVAGVLLLMVIFAGSGGVSRVGSISSAIVPVFVFLYMGMGFWVLLHNLGAIPAVLADIFGSAFTGHAAVGGFAGSGLMMTLSQGIRRGCYTTDVGIGYASIIHSESSVQVPEKQASLVIFDIFVDTFMICTMSVLLILVSGLWSEQQPAELLVQGVLGQYFPRMDFFMPFFLFLLGYSTINAYFCVGIKCADYLSPRWGKSLFYGYAVLALYVFSFVDSVEAQSVMAIVGGLLLILNFIGIFLLRKQVSFDIN